MRHHRHGRLVHAKIPFGVEEPAIPEDQLASGLARLIPNGLRSPGDS
jgi:hypothetical protein